MQVRYDRQAIESLIASLEQFSRDSASGCRVLEERFADERRSYIRLSSQIQELIDRASRYMLDAEAELHSAQAEYNAACTAASQAEEDSDRSAEEYRVSQAKARMARAEAALDQARADYHRQQGKLDRLSGAWNTHAAAVESNLQQLESEQNASASLVRTAGQDLELFIRHMEQLRTGLYGGPSGASAVPVTGASVSPVTGAAAPKGAAAPAWCPRHSMGAVSAGSGGKQLCLSIGGSTRQYSCDKNGLAQAYSAAVSAGDKDMTARIYAMFEIETLREDLDLGPGDSAFVQMGGYHRDVQDQDPAGYESHHIPARSVQDFHANDLPTISITSEDHARTPSYRGRQRHVSTPLFSREEPGVSYKDSISDKIGQGAAGYIEALRNEVWELRDRTGHRYDGGISAYLDAVIDMLATRGIPGSK